MIIKRKKEFISLFEASENCDYSQEYLSLRARQGKLKSRKIGRNWYTTSNWLKEYLDTYKQTEFSSLEKSLGFIKIEPEIETEFSGQKLFGEKIFKFLTSAPADFILIFLPIVKEVLAVVFKEIQKLLSAIRAIFLLAVKILISNFKKADFAFHIFLKNSSLLIYEIFELFCAVISKLCVVLTSFAASLLFIFKDSFSGLKELLEYWNKNINSYLSQNKNICQKNQKQRYFLFFKPLSQKFKLISVLFIILCGFYAIENVSVSKAAFFNFKGKLNSFSEMANIEILRKAEKITKTLPKEISNSYKITFSSAEIGVNKVFLDFYSLYKKSEKSYKRFINTTSDKVGSYSYKISDYSYNFTKNNFPGFTKRNTAVFLKELNNKIKLTYNNTANIISSFKSKTAAIKRNLADFSFIMKEELFYLSEKAGTKFLSLRDKITGVSEIKYNIEKEKKDNKINEKKELSDIISDTKIKIPDNKNSKIFAAVNYKNKKNNNEKIEIVKNNAGELQKIYEDINHLKEKNLKIDGFLSSEPKVLKAVLAKISLLEKEDSLKPDELDKKINELNSKILTESAFLKNQINDKYQANFNAIALSNKLNQLYQPIISSPTISSPSFSGNSSLQSLSTTGNADVGGNLTVSGNFNVSGTQTFTGNQTLTGALTVNSTTTLLSDLRVDTNTLVIDALNNRVGIGTTSPQYALDVDGALRASSIVANSQTIGGNFIITGNTTLGSATSSNTVYINSRFAGSLVPVSDNLLDIGSVSDWLRWRTGYFGTSIAISGTATSSGNSILSSGNYAIDANGTLSLNTSNNQPVNFGNGLVSIPAALNIDNGTFYVASSTDRIGIGTTTPNWLLQANATRPFFTLSDSSAGTDLKHWFLSSQGGNFYLGTSSDAYSTSTISALTINSNSKVGIGTTTPFEKFSVQGGVGADYLILSGNGTSTARNGFNISAGCFAINGVCQEQGITSLGGLTGASQTFANDTNVTVSSAGTTHTLGWTGTLAESRGGTGAASFGVPFYTFFNATNTTALSEGSNLYWTNNRFDVRLTGTTTLPQITTLTNLASVGTITTGVWNAGALTSSGVLTVNGTAASYIAGNLGIGTTTSPWNWNFQIASSTKTNFVLSDISAAANFKHWLLSSQGGNFYLGTSSDAYSTSTISALTINSNSKVGIGTTTPFEKFSVQGGVGADYLTITGATNATSTFSTGGLNIGNGQFVVQQTSGNVGVGSTSPSALLSLLNTSTTNGMGIFASTTLQQATGNEAAYTLNYTTNKAAGNDTGLLINMTDTASPGTSNLIEAISSSYGGTVFSVTTGGTATVGSNLNSGVSSTLTFQAGKTIGTAARYAIASTPNLTMTSGSNGGFNLAPTYNQTSGTAANTDLLINRTETAVGSGLQLLQDWQVGGNSKMVINNQGNVGIGTTTPNWLLQLNGTRPFFTLSDSSAGTNLRHWFLSSQGGNFYLGTSSDAYSTSTISALTINSNSKVGIGTTTPFEKFSVQGGVGADYLTITGATNATSTFSTGGLNIGNGQFVVQQTSGNVGVGTTSPQRRLHIWSPDDAVGARLTVNLTATNNSPVTPLELEAKTAVDMLDGFGPRISFMATDNTASLQALGAIGIVRAGADNTGDIVFRPATTGTENERLRITSGGSVGIGTTTPDTKFSVNGTTKLGNGAWPTATIGNPVNNRAAIIDDAGDAFLFMSNMQSGVAADRGANIYLGARGTTGSLDYSYSKIFGGRESASSGTYSSYLSFSMSNSVGTAIEKMRINSSGLVGIGTTTPNWLLQANGTRPFFTLSDSSAGTDLKHWFLSSQGGNLYFGTSSDVYATTSISAFMISKNGNVGIGTTTPGARLSIEGPCGDNDITGGCADIAELYNSSEAVEPGEIVAVNPVIKNQILDIRQNNERFSIKKAELGDAVIGIVSSNPAMAIEGSALQFLAGVKYENNPMKPAVALAGRVPVKVNLEGGEIKTGDKIALSSVSGVGMKATSSGITIGIALENFSEENSLTIVNAGQDFKTGKILVFVSLGYSKLEIAANNLEKALIVDFESGKIKSSFGLDMDNSDILNVRNILAKSGKWSLDENGKLIAEKIETERIEVKKPYGITIYDTETSEPICVVSQNRTLKSIPGKCEDIENGHLNLNQQTENSVVSMDTAEEENIYSSSINQTDNEAKNE